MATPTRKCPKCEAPCRALIVGNVSANACTAKKCRGHASVPKLFTIDRGVMVRRQDLERRLLADDARAAKVES